MNEVYTTYQAKTRFTEIIRKVRERRRVIVTYRGKPVAQIIPLDQSSDDDPEQAYVRGVESGLITPAEGSIDEIRPIARRPGALARFLDERD